MMQFQQSKIKSQYLFSVIQKVYLISQKYSHIANVKKRALFTFYLKVIIFSIAALKLVDLTITKFVFLNFIINSQYVILLSY